MRRSDVSRALAPLLGKKMSLKVIQTMLGQVIQGKRRLSPAWEGPLLQATGCATRGELLILYPGIQFPKTGNTDVLEVTVTLQEPVARVPADRITDVLHALKVLEQFGIKSEAQIRIVDR